MAKEQIHELDDSAKSGLFEDLPAEWRCVALKEVVQKARQVDPTKQPGQRFKYVDVSSVSSENLTIIGHTEYEGKNAPSRARKEIKAGDVVFATVRPSLRRVAIVPTELDGQVCSTAFCVLRARKEAVDPAYLFFATIFDSFVDRIAEHQRGSSYPAVTDNNVRNEVIPLPPLVEQKAIAHVLRSVQRAKEVTEKAIAAARQLKKSLMRHFFTYGPVRVEQADQVPLKDTEIGPMPEHWQVVELGDYAKLATGGTPSREKPTFWNGGIPWVRTGEINYRTICSTEETISAEGLANSNARLFPSGTLLAAMYGQGVTRGRVAILGIEATTNQACAAIFPGEKLARDFLYFTFIFAYERIREMGHGANQRNLSMSMLRPIKIALPPLSEQQEIAGALLPIDRKIAVEEQKRDACDVLFRTLLHNLMTGKVRVNELDFPLAAEGV